MRFGVGFWRCFSRVLERYMSIGSFEMCGEGYSRGVFWDLRGSSYFLFGD